MEKKNIDYHLDRIKQIQKQLHMQTINQIKDCQAMDLGYNSFRDLVLNPKQDQDMNHLNLCIERSMEEYAKQRIDSYIQTKLPLADLD